MIHTLFFVTTLIPTLTLHSCSVFSCAKLDVPLQNGDHQQKGSTINCCPSKFIGLAFAQRSNEVAARAAIAAKLIIDFATEARVGYVSLCIESGHKNATGKYGAEYIEKDISYIINIIHFLNIMLLPVYTPLICTIHLKILLYYHETK